MQYTFHVKFFGSSETSAHDDTYLQAYAERASQYEYSYDPPEKLVFSVTRRWENERRDKPSLTVDEVRQRFERLGYLFFDTEEEANRAADALFERCARIWNAVFPERRVSSPG